jgi:alpha-L-fucosidase
MNYKIVLSILIIVSLATGCNKRSVSDKNLRPDDNWVIPEETPDQHTARLEWWREGRLGMFIHYGPVSLTGKEISWSRANTNPACPNNGPTPAVVYDNLYKQFNPVNFNAAEWAGIAKDAGMKYVVLTAKHCDGFLLWNSGVDDYNIMHSPFKRDICSELANAVRNDGLRIGWYFSPMDWRDPDFRTGQNKRFLSRMQGEVGEILKNYGRIDLLWFDCDGKTADYDETNTYRIVKWAQPKIIINNRLDLDSGDSNRNLKSPYADYYTPEQQIGTYDDQHPWETCMTLGEQWSWKPNDKLKTAPEVISILLRIVGGDGNLLLDVGPMPDGRIEPRQVDILKQVGAWLQKNGESVYGTRGGPWKPGTGLSSTRKGNKVFLHLLQNNTGEIWLPDPGLKIKSASFTAGDRVAFEQANGKIHLTFDQPLPDQISSTICLELEGSAMDLAAIPIDSQNTAAERH